MTAAKKARKQNALLIAFALLSLVSCGKQENTSGSPLAPSAGNDTSPVSFELRDFSQTREVVTYGTYSYTRHQGRGTLLTRDKRLAAGLSQVWLRADVTAGDDPTWTDEIEVRDGIGTVNTIGSTKKGESESLEYRNWTILGYYELKPAILLDGAVSSQAGDKSAEKTDLPRFQMRDFSLKGVPSYNSGTDVKGEGTLVALDDKMKQGLYLVKMKMQRTNTEDPNEGSIVMVRDGIGSITTYVHQQKDEAAQGKVRYENWSIVGYTYLSKGRLVQRGESLSSSTSQAVAAEGSFELRDFALRRQDLAGVGSKVFGRGTLIAQDPGLKTGNVVVWLKCRISQYGATSQHFTLVMRDGVATVATEDLEFNSDPESKVSFSDWEVVGYKPLLKGEMVQPGNGK